MGGYGLKLALVLLLILLNAVFAGSEMALVSLREGQLRQLCRRGRRGTTLVRLVRDPNRVLATTQLGITLAGFLASAAAAVTLAEPLFAPLSFLGGAAEPVAVVLVTAMLTFATLVLGELAPKRLAMQRAERWGSTGGPTTGPVRNAVPTGGLVVEPDHQSDCPAVRRGSRGRPRGSGQRRAA